MAATVPCQMTGLNKMTEAMLLLREQAEVTLHGGHGAMSDGGLMTEAMLLLVEQAEVTLHGGHGAMSDGRLE